MEYEEEYIDALLEKLGITLDEFISRITANNQLLLKQEKELKS